LYDNIFLLKTELWSVTKDKLNSLLGQRIVELRTKKGWSQADLAREADKSPQAIEKLENGKVNPTLYSLYEIAKALGVSVSALTDF
jgi:transcriptional regulator with XRE-family HTH domain